MYHMVNNWEDLTPNSIRDYYEAYRRRKDSIGYSNKWKREYSKLPEDLTLFEDFKNKKQNKHKQ